MPRRKKNPDVIPWVVGAGAVGLVGYGVIRWLRKRNQPQPGLLGQGAAAAAAAAAAAGNPEWEARLAAFRQQQLGQQMQGMAGIGGGVMGMDHGIPIVALPGQSQLRTQQAMLRRPQVPGIQTQQQAGYALPAGAQQQAQAMTPAAGLAGGGSGSSQGESFGGSQGSLGGESF